MSAILQPPGLCPGVTLGEPTDLREEIRLGWPGLDPLQTSDDYLIFDDSGSMTVDGGNDPIGNRYAEARKAVQSVGAWTRTSRQRVAVLHFDYPGVEAIGPHRIDLKLGRTRIQQALTVPPRAWGSSALAPAMTATNKLAHESNAAAKRCTIFSDFELADANPGQAYAEIGRFPGHVHAVVLNAAPPAALSALPNVTITHISTESPPGLLAAAVMHSLATGRRGARLATLRRVPVRRA